jgi:hypothetical protein
MSAECWRAKQWKNQAVEKSAAELLVNFPERRVVGNPSGLWKNGKFPFIDGFPTARPVVDGCCTVFFIEENGSISGGFLKWWYTQIISN